MKFNKEFLQMGNNNNNNNNNNNINNIILSNKVFICKNFVSVLDFSSKFYHLLLLCHDCIAFI